MRPDLSVIVTTVSPKNLAHLLAYLREQSLTGITYEAIIVQESDGNFDPFTRLAYDHRHFIIRQPIHHDHGAMARDVGLMQAQGHFVVFWDDDNIYYPHALATSYAAACATGIGVVRVHHQGLVIPQDRRLRAGDIDTMCLCVQRDLAVRVKWADQKGRYNDYRWFSKVVTLTDQPINFCAIIIGEHL